MTSDESTPTAIYIHQLLTSNGYFDLLLSFTMIYHTLCIQPLSVVDSRKGRTSTLLPSDLRDMTPSLLLTNHSRRCEPNNNHLQRNQDDAQVETCL